MIILVCGLIGVGKTTSAKRIAQKINGTFLGTNTIRKNLYPNPKHSKDEIEHVYEAFFLEIKKQLKKNSNLVLDATFYKEILRQKINQIAKETNNDCKIVEIICNNDDKVRKRIESRKDEETKTNYGEYLKIKSLFEPVKDKKIIINNDGSIEELYQEIDKYFT